MYKKGEKVLLLLLYIIMLWFVVVVVVVIVLISLLLLLILLLFSVISTQPTRHLPAHTYVHTYLHTYILTHTYTPHTYTPSKKVKYVLKETRPVAILNLGGVGNITWIDPREKKKEKKEKKEEKEEKKKRGEEEEEEEEKEGWEGGKVVAFDTGPANGPVDDLVRERGGGGGYDKDGELASKGKVDEQVVKRFDFGRGVGCFCLCHFFVIIYFD